MHKQLSLLYGRHLLNVQQTQCLFPFHWKWPKEQVTTPQEWRPTEICPGTPTIFNIYISDLPTTISRKYTYADDLAIMHADMLMEIGRQWKGR